MQGAVVPLFHLRVAKPTIYHNVSALNIVYPRVAVAVRVPVSFFAPVSVSFSISTPLLKLLPRCHYAHVAHNHNDYVNALQGGAGWCKGA